MNDEITTEVLAKAIDATKSTVQEDVDEIQLNVNGKDIDYKIINKVASDGDHQLNAMAIAPIVDGKPDYNNVAVVYAGTNMGDPHVGKSGVPSAFASGLGFLSGECKPASEFLEGTQEIVSLKGGKITDVGGFSQAGGYMMKMSAEYGARYGFKTTSFDDYGKEQYAMLTKAEREWLDSHSDRLVRYQNDSTKSVLGLSGRDSKYGSVVYVTETDHNTLAKYFDGDALNLDRMAKDGLFAPGMSEAQVAEAAKNWAKNNGDWNPFTDDNAEAANRIKEYLKLYGSYGDGKYHPVGLSGAGAVSVDVNFAVTGPALIDEAIGHLEDIRQVNNGLHGQLEESYQRILRETTDTWSWILDSYDVEEAADRRGLQPVHHMDRHAITQVDTNITSEIEVLEALKATLVQVVTSRKEQDESLAEDFNF